MRLLGILLATCYVALGGIAGLHRLKLPSLSYEQFLIRSASTEQEKAIQAIRMRLERASKDHLGTAEILLSVLEDPKNNLRAIEKKPLREFLADRLESLPRMELTPQETGELLSRIFQLSPAPKSLLPLLQAAGQKALLSQSIEEFATRFRKEGCDPGRLPLTLPLVLKHLPAEIDPPDDVARRTSLTLFALAIGNYGDIRTRKIEETLRLGPPAASKAALRSVISLLREERASYGVISGDLHVRGISSAFLAALTYSREAREDLIRFYFGPGMKGTQRAELLLSALRELPEEKADLLGKDLVARLETENVERAIPGLAKVAEMVLMAAGDDLTVPLITSLLTQSRGQADVVERLLPLVLARKDIRTTFEQAIVAWGPEEQSSAILGIQARARSGPPDAGDFAESLARSLITRQPHLGSRLFGCLDLSQPSSRAVTVAALTKQGGTSQALRIDQFRRATPQDLSRVARDLLLELAERRILDPKTAHVAFGMIVDEDDAQEFLRITVERWPNVLPLLTGYLKEGGAVGPSGTPWRRAAEKVAQERSTPELLEVLAASRDQSPAEASRDLLATALRTIEDASLDASRRRELADAASGMFTPAGPEIDKIRILRHASPEVQRRTRIDAKKLIQELADGGSKDENPFSEASDWLCGEKSVLAALPEPMFGRLLGDRRLIESKASALLVAVMTETTLSSATLETAARNRGWEGGAGGLFTRLALGSEPDPRKRLSKIDGFLCGSKHPRYGVPKAGEDDQLLSSILAEVATLSETIDDDADRSFRLANLLAFMIRRSVSPKVEEDLIRAFNKVPEKLRPLRWDLYLATAEVADERATTFLLENFGGQTVSPGTAKTPPPHQILTMKIQALTGLLPVSQGKLQIEQWLKTNRARLKDQIQ
jgi:hypothetical protein